MKLIRFFKLFNIVNATYHVSFSEYDGIPSMHVESLNSDVNYWETGLLLALK